MKPNDTITAAQAQKLIGRAYRQGKNEHAIKPEHRVAPPWLEDWLKNPHDLPAGYIVGWSNGLYLGISPEGRASS